MLSGVASGPGCTMWVADRLCLFTAASVCLPRHCAELGSPQMAGRRLFTTATVYACCHQASHQPTKAAEQRKKNTRLYRGTGGSSEKRNKEEDKREREGYCSLTKGAGDECLAKPRDGSVTVGLAVKSVFNSVSELHSMTLHPLV